MGGKETTPSTWENSRYSLILYIHMYLYHVYVWSYCINVDVADQISDYSRR